MTRGNVEAFRHGILSGWAASDNGQPVELVISVNGVEFERVFANGPRDDVIAAGMAFGHSGFSVSIPYSLYAASGAAIDVLAADSGELLSGCPYQLGPLTPTLEGTADRSSAVIESDVTDISGGQSRGIRGNVERFDGRALVGWALDGTGNPLLLAVHIDGDLFCEVAADIEREDLVEAGLTNSGGGFSVVIPQMFFRDAGCIVEVFDVSSGEPIFGSPFAISSEAGTKDEEVQNLGSISHLVGKIADGAVNADSVRANIIHILSWLQHSVNRLVSLGEQREIEFHKLKLAIEEAGGLAVSASHFHDFMQLSYEQLFFSNARPLVSIVIPVYNNFALTYACIKSISEAKDSTPFEIIIVDDCSTDETIFSSLVFIGNVTTVRTPRNLGFLEACNIGAGRAAGSFLLFLNNDTIVSDKWLDPLVATMTRDPKVGIVGSRLIYPDGSLQEVGGLIWRDGSGWNWGHGGDKEHPSFSFMRDADYVSGACLMIRRELWERLNGFDSFFAPAYYEDTDLCFRARAAGYRVVVQPASTIVHLEGRSNGRSTTAGLKKYQVVNAKKFRDKWARVLREHGDPGTDPCREAERTVKKKAIFVDETTPTPDQDAGSNAAFQHMLSLQRLGYKVVFLPADNMARIAGYSNSLQAAGIECWYAPYAWSVEEFLRKNKGDFQLVYIHRKSNMTRYFEVIRKYLPNAVVIFNYADIHALREIREAKVLGAPKKKLDALKHDLESETALAKAADVAIVHSSFEADLITHEHPSAVVRTVPWPFLIPDSVVGIKGRFDVGFVGGFNHPPNVDAVDWFVSNVWPIVLRDTLDHEFRIAGSSMPARFSDYDIPRIDAVGFVADLDRFLDDLAVTVAPLRYGAGLKGKVLNSMARGVPCVMTSIAAEGMDLPASLRDFVQDNPRDMADQIRRLLNDQGLWNEVSSASVEFIRNNYSSALVDQLMKNTIESGIERSRNRRSE